MNQALIITSLIMGLTGSLHCAGMCGPLVMMMPFQHTETHKKIGRILLYHGGRISVYMIMGLIIYTLKFTINPKWQQYFSIFAGAALLLVGLMSFAGTMRFNLPWVKYVQKWWGKLLSSPGLLTFWGAGMLNGLLPCGLVYMALSVCVNVQSWGEATANMAAFGVGTFPMLFVVSMIGHRIALFTRRGVQRLVPLTLILLSSLIMLRGMNLGVPYLSPKMSIEKEVVKSSCCHKPD